MLQSIEMAVRMNITVLQSIEKAVRRDIQCTESIEIPSGEV